MEMGRVLASELHLTPRRLPCLSASAPAHQLPSLASSSFRARGCLGRPPRRPAAGRVAPLVTLFCLNGQRLKATAAALRSELEGGRSRGCLGNRAASTRLPLAGRSCEALAKPGSPGVAYRPRRRQRSCSPAELRGPEDETELSTREHTLPTNGAQVIKAESEFEFCATDCRAGRPTVSRRKFLEALRTGICDPQ
ncbi:uncharacterized protein LOC129024941 isoform X2 [Pongo pygmaeus]|uniref:uncharacterized protein LOC129024941 isoform X2 n=2 Tax=Pongo pygmaeus TaxID=9600 RepID=UPI00300D2385